MFLFVRLSLSVSVSLRCRYRECRCSIGFGFGIWNIYLTEGVDCELTDSVVKAPEELVIQMRLMSKEELMESRKLIESRAFGETMHTRAGKHEIYLIKESPWRSVSLFCPEPVRLQE